MTTTRAHIDDGKGSCTRCFGPVAGYPYQSLEERATCKKWEETKASGPGLLTPSELDAAMRAAGFEASGHAAELANKTWKVNGNDF